MTTNAIRGKIDLLKRQEQDINYFLSKPEKTTIEDYRLKELKDKVIAEKDRLFARLKKRQENESRDR